MLKSAYRPVWPNSSIKTVQCTSGPHNKSQLIKSCWVSILDKDDVDCPNIGLDKVHADRSHRSQQWGCQWPEIECENFYLSPGSLHALWTKLPKPRQMEAVPDPSLSPPIYIDLTNPQWQGHDAALTYRATLLTIMISPSTSWSPIWG